MILILSQGTEQTTCDVIDWIDYMGGHFYRLNGDDWQYNFSLNLQGANARLELKDIGLDENSIQSVWLRRGGDKKQPDLSSIDNQPNVKEKLEKLLKDETRILRRGFFKVLRNKPWLSDMETVSPNKIYMLLLAQQAGLDVPTTCICSSKKEINNFLKQHGRAITKNIFEATSFDIDGELSMQYTQQVNPEVLEEYDENMYACLLQEMIDKEVELRIFYLDGRCYGMAIFSQLDEQTAVDFRRYNDERPNRNVPYKLPAHIEEKVIKFMQLAEMNTGSIDMIKSKDGRYIFLEVNPVGQFGMTSQPCNYFLEKKVAEWLMDTNKNKN